MSDMFSTVHDGMGKGGKARIRETRTTIRLKHNLINEQTSARVYRCLLPMFRNKVEK